MANVGALNLVFVTFGKIFVQVFIVFLRAVATSVLVVAASAQFLRLNTIRFDLVVSRASARGMPLTRSVTLTVHLCLRNVSRRNALMYHVRIASDVMTADVAVVYLIVTALRHVDGLADVRAIGAVIVRIAQMILAHVQRRLMGMREGSVKVLLVILSRNGRLRANLTVLNGLVDVRVTPVIVNAVVASTERSRLLILHRFVAGSVVMIGLSLRAVMVVGMMMVIMVVVVIVVWKARIVRIIGEISVCLDHISLTDN